MFCVDEETKRFVRKWMVNISFRHNHDGVSDKRKLLYSTNVEGRCDITLVILMATFLSTSTKII